jgi:hypothetical protein
MSWNSHIVALAATGTLCLALTPLRSNAAEPVCQIEWMGGGSLPGVDGTVLSVTLWDPDGSGPLKPHVVAAGEFTMAGSVDALNIAIWDGTAWAAMGAGLNAQVRALAVLPDGTLFAGGDFEASGTQSLKHIARWSPSTGKWIPVGAGFGFVNAMAVRGSDLIVGGGFNTTGGPSYIARWNGITWLAMNSQINGVVRALAVLPDASVVAGGDFRFTRFGQIIASVARWDGSQWQSMNATIQHGGTIPTVTALAATSEGHVILGADSMTGMSGVSAQGIARWNGSTWSGIGDAKFYSVSDVATLPDGSIVVAGRGFFEGPQSDIMRFDGAAWQPLSSGIPDYTVQCVRSTADGGLFAGGSFRSLGDVPAAGVARLTAGSWTGYGMGFSGSINAFAEMPNGDVIAAGTFVSTPNGLARRVARWDGIDWHPLGTGVNGRVNAVAVLLSGEVVAGGVFSEAGGVAANNIAVWDGSGWRAAGTGVDGEVHALLALDGHRFMAGGRFNQAGGIDAPCVARWNGTEWVAVGGAGWTRGSRYLVPYSTPTVLSFAKLLDGSVLAAGQFQDAPGVPNANSIVRWDGTSWRPLRGGLVYQAFDGSIAPAQISALVVHPSGDAFAGGIVTAALGPTPWKPLGTGVGRWDGDTWDHGRGFGNSLLWSFPAGFVATPGGDIVVRDPYGLSISNGSTRSVLSWNRETNAIAVHSRGEILVGGGFDTLTIGSATLKSPSFVRFRGKSSVADLTAQAPCADGAPWLVFSGTSPYTVAWEIEDAAAASGWSPVVDGPLVVNGVTLGTVTQASTPFPRIVPASGVGGWAARFRATVANACNAVTSNVVRTVYCPGELTCDEVVDEADFETFSYNYDTMLCADSGELRDGTCPGDLNYDGLVDDTDFTLFVVAYDAMVCP